MSDALALVPQYLTEVVLRAHLRKEKFIRMIDALTLVPQCLTEIVSRAHLRKEKLIHMIGTHHRQQNLQWFPSHPAQS